MPNKLKKTKSSETKSAGWSVLAWLDDHILTILTGILIVVVPLYPKIPLAELIEGYIVRLRFEDLLILGTFIIWLIQLARGKVRLPKNPIARGIFIYLGIGLLSTLSALVITETVPLVRSHILKLLLHLFRRVEYFSLFFITYSAIRTRKDLVLFCQVALFSLLGVVIYGIGQKYFYWPAFSTMNREFSKGVRLYLQPNTRLFSTFGGHYDLAGYLMMMLAFTVPAAWISRKRIIALALSILSLFAYWCLVLTTSRTSFIGYLVGITIAAAILYRFKGFWWVFKRYFVTMLLSLVIMFSFSNLLERFTQVIPNKDLRDQILAIQKSVNEPFVKEPSGTNKITELPSLFDILFKKAERVEVAVVPKGVDPVSVVASQSDIPPSTVKPTPDPELPSDVTSESEDIRKGQAELSGKEYVGPNYSPNALKYGLSMGIRLDALWPQAIAGLKKNPFLGTGYSTLVKTSNDEFTYAESTDNDYLRMLGETGILGAGAFLYLLYLVFRLAAKQIDNTNVSFKSIFAIGVIGATAALMVNALYIDIFESSKIAYTFWMMVAALVAADGLHEKNS